MSYLNLLTDTCSVVRRTPGTFNTGTGVYGAPTDTPIYSGPCRVAPLSGVMARRVVLGDEAVSEHGKWVFLPLDATGPTIEDVVTVTASEDATVIGREMVVKHAAAEYSPVTTVASRWLVVEDYQEGP